MEFKLTPEQWRFLHKQREGYLRADLGEMLGAKMYPRTYYETFMRYEASDQVFVAMPFTDDFQDSFNRIIEPAVDRVRINGRRLNTVVINRHTTGAPDIHEAIYDAIIHSRLVIADMSVQATCEIAGALRWQPNANVAYEVGLATTWRNPEDILLIHRPHPSHSYSFDIQNLRHLQYAADDIERSIELLTNEMVLAIRRSTFIGNKFYDDVAQSLSSNAVRIMHAEATRAFPMLTFKNRMQPSFVDTLINGIDELLAAGAIRSRTVIREPDESLHIIYRWTDLGYRLMATWRAATPERIAEMKRQAASIPESEIPPSALLTFAEPPPAEVATPAPSESQESATAAGQAS